ncbi:hypothetical protein EOM86_12325, partial [Candidatus Nomurabacteria bacterium]|nr:hypothetical protein [Candidatus Nomurabacteria bacterium]
MKRGSGEVSAKLVIEKNGACADQACNECFNRSKQERCRMNSGEQRVRDAKKYLNKQVRIVTAKPGKKAGTPALVRYTGKASTGFTVGGVYRVVSKHQGFYVVVNDKGDTISKFKSCFEPVTRPNFRKALKDKREFFLAGSPDVLKEIRDILREEKVCTLKDLHRHVLDCNVLSFLHTDTEYMAEPYKSMGLT